MRPLSAAQHAGQVGTRQPGERADVERDQRVELLGIGLGERREVAQSRVVDEHVDAGYLGHDPRDGTGLGQIDSAARAAPPSSAAIALSRSAERATRTRS